MAIKISSINIRRLYSEEELGLANKIREYQTRINDIKTLEKIRQVKNTGIEQENDLSDLTWQELQEFYMSESYKDASVKYRDKKKVDKINSFLEKHVSYIDKTQLDEFSRNDEELKQFRKDIANCSKELKQKLKDNTTIRNLKTVFESDLVAISESALTDSLYIEKNTTSEKIVIITSDQEDMMKNIIEDGFMYNGEHYGLYGSSAGQLRKKKLMFIESKAMSKAIPKLTNGLGVEDINSRGGVNINKWSAYMALSTSATTIWDEVDLDRVCVVDDFETVLKNREVDHINDKYEINRIEKDVMIPHTDGFGMMHPRFCRDTRMIRAPWIKGLLAPMDYRSFVRTFNGNPELTDIWGDTYHIDDIDIILTKSQFKMWKYYDDWSDYKTKFLQNGCEFRFMIQESKKDLRLNALFNYQMWNTLEIDDNREFADEILAKDKELIKKAHSEVGAMLNMFHVDKDYKRNNYIGKALYLYPQMLKTSGFKTTLMDKIAARKKEMRQGRIKVNGVYTFIIPDVFAWCEHLFLGVEEPVGLLADGEVSCKLVNRDKDILVNRSPHLYSNEHCVRRNIKEKEHIRWFIGKGVYTSVNDMISKQLFFDVDGDIALVVENDKLVDLAKKTTRGLVPLDFELSKAPAQVINNDNIYESYNLAFGVNIGYYSNLITKVMCGDARDIGLVAKICYINNQAIDYAKTKFMIDPTEELKQQLKSLDKQKLPYFFIWAKDKNRNSVAEPNENSVVDMMALSTDDSKYERYSYKNIEDFDINVLLSNENVEDDENLVNEFKRLANSKYHTMIKRRVEGNRDFKLNYVNNQIIGEMYDYIFTNGFDIDEAADVCIKYVFEKNKDRDVLFTIFGDVIVGRLEQMFQEIVEGSYTRCEVCGKLIKNTNGKSTYCDKCKKKKQLEWDREAKRRKRNKN